MFLKKKSVQTGAENAEMEQRPITESDVCPICQDELLTKKLPVSYCRFNN
jgi:E3 ubiquitin-protein ligase ZSWIM2